jgi:hypothetical protein
MLKKIISTSALSLIALSLAHADGDSNNNSGQCYIEVAVSSPPVDQSESVAFNASNTAQDTNINYSVTVTGGSAPKKMDNVPCAPTPYYITATPYNSPTNAKLKTFAVGRCDLKNGPVSLTGEGNSVSVVFPDDFECN